MWAGLGASMVLRLRPTTIEQAMQLAVKYRGQGRYVIGGGADVFAPTPFDSHGAADCSSYTSYLSGHSRRQGDQTFNTTGMVKDAYDLDSIGRVRGPGARRLYDPVAYAAAGQALSLVRLRPGDLLVRPWIGSYIGHSAFVMKVGRDPRRAWHQNLVISHMGSVVVVGSARSFAEGPVFAIRPRHYRKPPRVASTLGVGLLGLAAVAGALAYYRRSRRGRIWG
jgi:hypothetical protein